MPFPLAHHFGWYWCRRAVPAALVAMAWCGNLLRAQTAENLSDVKQIVVDWPSVDRVSTATRDRLVQKLKSSGAVQLAENAGASDAILRGSVEVWVSGYVSTSPRSHASEQAIYHGYASVEVTGKGGRTLWSYLVTPRSPGWKSLSNDLGNQLAQALLSALAKKETREAPSTAHSDPSARSAAIINIAGAGATFPAPLYQKWLEGFAHVRPEAKITYSAIGSEQGIARVMEGATDFGATDMPLAAQQLKAPGKELLQFATVLGAVVPIYHVGGAPPEGLNFTGEILAGIFLGKIRRWNAPEILAVNRHAHLPDRAIAVIHRSDGSGTTFAWTDYLCKVSEEWRSKVAAGTTVNWPTGEGVARNDGVADAVHKTPNSIGYVEFIYALQHELEYAAVRNVSGEFVKADLDSVTAAAKTAVLQGEAGFGVSITNARGKHVYPISTFTWLLLPRKLNDAAKESALHDLLRWMLTTGQKQCEGLGYSPLPAELAVRELHALAGLPSAADRH